jgi:transmembrane sensor
VNLSRQTPQQRLSNAVHPEVTESRVTRQWSSIERRLPRRPSVARGPIWIAGVAALPLLAAGLYWFSARSTPVPTTGTVIESASTPVTVTLRDGSTLALDAQTRLRLLRDEPQDVDVELATGKANFDVTHVGGRAFRVHAGIVQVKVLGTRFEVAKTPRKEGTHIQVAVARGVVEVQRLDGTGGVRRLNAGETWSALIPSHSVSLAPAALAPASASPDRASAEAAPTGAARPTATLPEAPAEQARPDLFSPERAPPQPLARDDARDSARDRRLAREEKRSSRARAAALARERTVTSATLFKRGNLARRTGQTHEAADAYADLLKRFPDDGRAGLVAFELGRIRMDALSQPKAAVEAFGIALRSAPRASFREDALARIVVADDQLGEYEACNSARDRYLKDFPNGVHALALASRCGKAGH